MTKDKPQTPSLRLAAANRVVFDLGGRPDAMSHRSGGSGASPGPRDGPEPDLRLARGLAEVPGAVTYRLRLLATTDIHGQILSYDYFANRPQFGMGLAQTASLIAAARAESPEAILLDNGDFLQGSALAELAAAGRLRRRPHPAIAAFNALGYDAAALGNHEFNYGLATLRAALAAARFPVLSANVALRLGPQPLEDRLLAAPYALVRRQLTGSDGSRRTVTVGVLGLTPPEILDWDHGLLAGQVEVRPMVQAARAWVPALRRAGADLVVCLAHTGISDLAGPDRHEGVATEIAEIDGVDVVIAGHSHEVFPNAGAYADPRIDAQAGRLAGKPAVQPGHSGTHLGIVDLVLRPDMDDRWRLGEARVRAQSASEVVAGMTSDAIRRGAAPLKAVLGPDHRAALNWTRQTIGKSRIPLSTHFALAADVQAMRVLAAAKVAHVRAALQGRPEAALPILAAVTPFRTGGRGGPLNFTEIPAGPLSVRHVFDLYPFPNAIVASRLTGAQLAARLEVASTLFRQIVPGLPDQPLIDPRVTSFSYETIPGLSYRIDLSQPQGRPGRIRDLCLDGRALAPEAELVLVSNSYRLGTLPLLSGAVLIAAGRLVTSVVADFIRASGEIGPVAGPGWSFLPMPGTSVVFDTGAGALSHLDEVAHLAPVLTGLTGEGFHRFRLQL